VRGLDHPTERNVRHMRIALKADGVHILPEAKGQSCCTQRRTVWPATIEHIRRFLHKHTPAAALKGLPA
jgi:hypothetical protein